MIKRKIVERLFGAALLAGIIGAPLLAAAPALDPVKVRVTGFQGLGSAFKNVNDQLKSDTPQAFIIQLSARDIQNAAGQIKTWFPAGSGPKPGRKTAAKPEIWAQAKQFNAARDAFIAKANSFSVAAKGGDIPTIQAEAKALGQTCSACHKDFRADKR